MGSIHAANGNTCNMRRYSPENPGRAAQSFARYIEERYAVELSATQIG